MKVYCLVLRPPSTLIVLCLDGLTRFVEFLAVRGAQLQTQQLSIVTPLDSKQQIKFVPHSFWMSKHIYMGFESQLNNISSSVTFDMLLRPYVLIAFITGDVLKKNIYMTDDFELFKIGKLF